MHQAFCQIVPLNRFNWESCLDIELYPEQQSNIPGIMYSLAQAKFEDLTPFGIMHHDRMVGMMMYGNFSGVCWISRILVDKNYQRMGIGRTALRQLLERLRKDMRCKEIRTSYAINNHTAASFFNELGFKPIISELEDEVVAVYEK